MLHYGGLRFVIWPIHDPMNFIVLSGRTMTGLAGAVSMHGLAMMMTVGLVGLSGSFPLWHLAVTLFLCLLKVFA